MKSKWEDFYKTEDDLIKAYWQHNGFFLICSNCDYFRDTIDNEGYEIPDNYCPKCGYKMKGIKYGNITSTN